MSESAYPYLNRELSWLAFNQRVLEEAQDAALPLLERLKFLAITGSNLDEFFMVRVGGIKLLVESGQEQPDPSGLAPAQQLAEISRRAHQMAEDQYRLILQDLEPRLAEAGIVHLRPDALSSAQSSYLDMLFEHEIFPVITPIAVDLEEVFPLFPGLGLNLAVRLGGPAPRFAVVALPRSLARFITLPTEQGYHYILLEEVIRMFAARLFPGEPVAECRAFRITRNADMSVREDLAGDLLSQMKEILTERKQSSCVRLEIEKQASTEMNAFLREALVLKDEDVYLTPGPIDLSAYLRLAGMGGFDPQKNEPWPPQTSPEIREQESIFDALKRSNLLLHHPYEGFDPVLRLIQEAADDPGVLAIKQILYRTSENSPVVAALMRAADKGKHVTALVELKARFDEARNIEWASALERAGVQVIYGIKGFKTHAKVCIVVRREPEGIARYVHFGTGNYNERTARLYTDVSFMTREEDYGADASVFFNTITGYSQPVTYRKIESAPLGLRARLLELIENEIERTKQGQAGQIMAKLNSLADPALIEALYRASQAGVKIELNVRGVCCLKPGVPGISENISVVSIVDRFLEHSRIFCFHNGGEQRLFISSADWMPRNLDRRVELLIEVEDPRCARRLLDILQTCLKDTAKGRRLEPEGSYARIKAEKRKGALRAQEVFYRQACEAARRAEKEKGVVFEPQRPATAK